MYGNRPGVDKIKVAAIMEKYGITDVLGLGVWSLSYWNISYPLVGGDLYNKLPAAGVKTKFVTVKGTSLWEVR